MTISFRAALDTPARRQCREPARTAQRAGRPPDRDTPPLPGSQAHAWRPAPQPDESFMPQTPALEWLAATRLTLRNPDGATSNTWPVSAPLNTTAPPATTFAFLLARSSLASPSR
jgi:hypothetical protein